MGQIISYLRNTYSSLYLFYVSCSSVQSSLSRALARIALSPGLPVPAPTAAAWQDPPHPTLPTDAGTLPEHADIVIIGSGITAASLALQLLKQDATKDRRIAIVDARAICSGATGRNGGHIKDTPFLEWEELVRKFGRDSARRIIEFRMSHMGRVRRAAEEVGAVEACEIRQVDTVDTFFHERVWEDARRQFVEFVDEFPEYAKSGEWRLWEQDEAREKFQLPTVLGAVTYPASALAPYTLVTSVFAHLLERHANLTLHPHTAITAITPVHSTSTYALATASGATIAAPLVIHATNAHASHLLPGLRGRILPMRGQMTALRAHPAPAATLPGGASRSWSFFHDRGYDYLTLRPSGTIMLGGGWAQGGEDGLRDVGVARDDACSPLALAHVLGLLPSVFAPGVLRGVEVDARWTGNLGMSVDWLPWVGRARAPVSRRADVGQGEWVAAGYSGEGMVNAWGCGEALARMVAGEDGGGLPRELLISDKRLREGSLQEMAAQL